MTWKTIRGISLAIVLLAMGCGGGSSSDGVAVGFTASHSTGLVPQPVGAKTFTNTEAATIILTRAYLVVWSEEIFNDCDGSFVQLPDRWLDWLVPTARAHANDAPTRQGSPQVVDIIAADDTMLALGATNPPPDDYCGAEIILRAADADTLQLPTDIDMAGRSLYLEGSYQTGSLSSPVAFTVSSSRTLLPARRHLQPPLSLDAQTPAATIDIVIHYTRWFDQLDLALLASGDDAQTEALLQNVTEAIEVSWR